jgi:hypothetical protein
MFYRKFTRDSNKLNDEVLKQFKKKKKYVDDSGGAVDKI